MQQDQNLIKDTLQTRYRPNTWDRIIGQEHITDVLKGIIKHQTYKFTRSYIFSGQAGSGKTTSARVLANAIICDHTDPEKRPCLKCSSCQAFSKGNYPDTIEIDAGQFNKVEDVKRLIDIAKVYPIQSHKFRIILLDEAHRLSNAAWDSMLKLLEDGKTKTIFMFATTEGDKIRRAIHSRSISFQIKPLSVKEIQNELLRVCELEGIQYDIPSIESISYANRGRMRDALKTLDMYYRSKGSATNIAISTSEEKFCEILQLTAMQKYQEALEILDKMTVETDIQLGQYLCSAISAIYTHPLIHTTGVPESVLQRTKNLIGKDIKKIIDTFMEYKPQNYEQVKLFLLVLCDLQGTTQSKNSVTEKRQLFKGRENKAGQVDEEGF